MAWNNDKFIDFMKGIIPSSNAENEYDINDIRGSLTTMLQSQNITFNEALEHMWKSFLDFIQQEGLNSNSLPNGILPITQNLFNKTENVTSLFEFINDKIDLNDTFFTNLLNNYTQNNINLSNSSGLNSNNYFWNESVSYLISYIVRNLTRNGITYGDGLTISWTNGSKSYSTNIKNILQSNAFKDQVNYVQPINNISGVSYKNTRGEDLIQADTEEENLQFTNEANINNSLRLGMPEYERKVKVEDLNRNFWVISQCIAGISAYLFEDNSPISTAFNKILNELVQLWENLLYLWAIFAISIQNDKEYTDVHTEVVPLSISDLYNFRKYDNFDLYPSMSITPSDLNSLKIKILQNIKYLEDMYPESNLCIIPFLRVGNYEHNYYTEEWYPGVALFNRNKEQNLQWDFKYFNPTYAPQMINYDGTKYGIRFKLNGNIPKFSSNGSSQGSVVISDNIWTATRAKAGEVKALYPYSQANSYEEWDNDNYYAALRCIPSNFSASYINHEVVFGGGKISIIDAIGESIKKWASTIDSEDARYTQVQEFKQMDILYGEYVFGEDFNESGYPIGNEGINTTQTIRTINDIAPFGYYLGELISGMGTSLKKYPEFIYESIYGRPLIQDMSDFNKTNAQLNATFFSSLIGNDKTDLEQWAQQESNSIVTSFDFYFLYFAHQFNITASDTNVYNFLSNYWDYNNGTLSQIEVDDSQHNGRLISSDPVLSYNSNDSSFYNKTLSQVVSDAASKYYQKRSGQFSIISALWNPFVEKFYYLPNFLFYNRISLSPSTKHNPKWYNKVETDTYEEIGVNKYYKNGAYLPIVKLKRDDVYKRIENQNQIIARTVTQSVTHTRASLCLFDSSKTVQEDNWAVKYTRTSIHFNCIFNESDGLVYTKDNNEYISDGRKMLGFRPFNIKNNWQEYPYIYPHDNLINVKKVINGEANQVHNVTDDVAAKIIYQIIKNDVEVCYYIDTSEINKSNYDYYRSPFYTAGYIFSNSDEISEYWDYIQTDFNTLYDYIKGEHAISIENMYNRNINISSLPNKCGAKQFFSSAGVTTINLMELIAYSYMSVITSYVSSRTVAHVFPNQNYVSVFSSTYEVDGHNTEERETIYNFSSNFDCSEYLPEFIYDINKTYKENYNGWEDTNGITHSGFQQIWNAGPARHVLYSSSALNASLVTADGVVEPFKNNKLTLNFSKYINNGYCTLSGDR